MLENEFISALKGYLRLGNFPLDASSVFENLAEAITYAGSNPTAYAGQVIAVADLAARTVTIYQLGFKLNVNDPGLELQNLSAQGGAGTVRSVNGILPDESGNITVTLEELDNILTFLQNTPDRVVFNKVIQSPTISISQDNDVITKRYLDAVIDDYFGGINGAIDRTVKVEFGPNGGLTADIIPGRSVIKRVAVNIKESFAQSTITGLIGTSTVIFDPNEIYEEEEKLFVSEPYIEVSGDREERFPIRITVDGPPNSEQGLAEVYIQFIVFTSPS